MRKCLMCDTRTKDKDLCPDGNCRKCHVSLSFEDCCDGTWTAQILVSRGRSVEEVKKLYPNARI